MSVSQRIQKRQKSGAKKHSMRDKRKVDLGREPVSITVGATQKKEVRSKGGTRRTTLKSTDVANIVDPATKKVKKVAIKAVKENAANRHYARRNIITKGAIIDTDLGEARVTNRPGQDGVVNAVLLSK